jgi:ABC-type glycerol-3-phosphate transport system substrate-binding protein
MVSLVLLALCIAGTPALTTQRAHAAVQNVNVTITLAGPNQWNSSSTSFGPPWEKLVAEFEAANPGVTLKTDVLPLATFFQTEATLLQAGSAPELIFDQTNFKAAQVLGLDKYLMQPNPYAPGRPRWYDWFDHRAFNESNKDTLGRFYFIPFNLFDNGLYVNLDAFKKAGVSVPIKTWEDWRAAVPKLKAAGYVPLAMDSGYLGYGWTFLTISNMLLAKYFDSWNVYLQSGARGKAKVLTLEDYTRVLKMGVDLGHLPEMAESLILLKEVFDTSAVKNWSGIKETSGAGVDAADFISGKAAMMWGGDFGYSTLMAAHPSFQIGSMPWPTITKATTSLSTDFPAQYGESPGGTSYMIPATTSGDKLTYAIRFMQFVTAPKYNQPWITATSAAPSVLTVKPVPGIAAFGSGHWGEQTIMSTVLLFDMSPQSNAESMQIIPGFLLGTMSLAKAEDALQASWLRAANYNLQQNPQWKTEPWAK